MFLFAVTAGCFLVCGLKWSPPPGMWFWGRRAPTEEKTGKKNMTALIFWLAIDRSQNPPTLSYCCHDDKQCRSHTTHMFSRSEKYIAEQRGNWQHTDREDRAGYFWYETRSQDPQLLNGVIFKEIKTINTVLWLFNVSRQIAVLPRFKHVNRSSFHIYLKHEMNMNKHQNVFYFNRGTPFFKFKSSESTPVWFVVKVRRATAVAILGMCIYIFSEPTI